MNTQMTQNPSNLPSKQALTDFIHDVADMETSAFTMREAARIVREDAERKESNLKWKIHGHQNVREQAQKKYDGLNEELKKNNSWDKYFKNYHSGLRTGWIVVCAIAAFLFMMLLLFRPSCADEVSYYQDGGNYLNLQEAKENLKANGIAMFVMFCIIVGWDICYGLPVLAYTKKKYRQFIDRLNQDIQAIQATIASETQKAMDAQTDLDAFLQTLPFALARADRLDADAELIEEKIRQCYALDVIKPAYRKMVCVVVLDEIFINDKADTMREAMILCDAEIRHADIMGKMDRIIDALHMLAYRLESMTTVLENINTNVGLIAQDVYDMKNTQEQMNYSMDAIRRSAENADQYINQRRMGGL